MAAGLSKDPVYRLSRLAIGAKAQMTFCYPSAIDARTDSSYELGVALDSVKKLAAQLWKAGELLARNFMVQTPPADAGLPALTAFQTTFHAREAAGGIR